MAALSRQPAPIFGREREQARLRELLDQAITGQGSLVLVSGEAGIGKTTLVNDLARQADTEGVIVLSGGCYDLTTTPPYGPWVEVLFRSYMPVDELPPVPDALRDLDAIESQGEFFDLVFTFFSTVAAHRPLLIILEDLHWTDSASLDFLRTFSRHLNRLPLLLVVTYRDDEITRRYELYELIPTLVRESHAQRLHLGRLDQLAVEEIVRTLYPLDEADTSRLVGYLWQRSEGNPLFAGEMLLGLEDEGVLHSTPESWKLGELDQLRVPAVLRQVLDARLQKLRSEARAALQIAAVIGQEVSLDLWQTVAGLDDVELDAVVDEALRARLLEETLSEPEFRFRHALIREALYTSLIVTHRRRRHRQVGEALTAFPQPDPDEVAHHFEQANDRRVVEWLLRAGVRAEGRYAWRIAADNYDKVQLLLERNPEAAQARGWLLLQIGHLLRYIDYEQSIAHLEEAEQVAARFDDPVLTAFSWESQGLILCFLGQVGAGVAMMADAAELLNNASMVQKERACEEVASLFSADVLTNPRMTSGSMISFLGPVPSVNVITPIYVLWLAIAGRFREAIATGKPFVTEASAAIESELLRQNLCRDAYQGLALAFDALGKPEQARQWRMQALAAYEAVGHHVNLASTYSNELEHLVSYATDRVAERRRIAQAAVAAAERAGGPFMAVERPAREQSVLLDIIEGRWDEARELAAATLPDRSGAGKGVRGDIVGTLGGEQKELRKLAWDHVDEILPDSLATKPGVTYFGLAVAAQRLAATLFLDGGELEAARSWLKMHDAWLVWSGAALGKTEGALLWARYHRITGDQEAARQQANLALEYASNPRQPLALIAAHRTLGELATDDKQFAEAEEQLDTSLSLAQTCEVVYEIALTRLGKAELAIATGDVGRATELLAQVRETGEILGAELTVARVESREQQLATLTETYPAGLTAREVEVLRLVAQGMSNAEAGAELFIRPRTVGQHLRNIYNKIGVNNRTEATRWAVENELVA